MFWSFIVECKIAVYIHFNHLLLCSTESIDSIRFGTTWGWVNNEWVFSFAWTNHIRNLTPSFSSSPNKRKTEKWWEGGRKRENYVLHLKSQMKGSVLGLRARPLIFTVVRLKACIKQKTGTEGKIENRKHCNLSMREEIFPWEMSYLWKKALTQLKRMTSWSLNEMKTHDLILNDLLFILTISVPFLQSTANSHSDLPRSNQQQIN